MEDRVSRMVSDSALETTILFNRFVSPEKKSFDTWWSWFINNDIPKPNMPSVFCWLVWQGCAAQQSVQLTALRRGLALSLFINVILLAVVLFTIGGN
jgi:hypothetical protein